MSPLEIATLAALGATAQELLWWYNARFSLDQEQYRRISKSAGYWAITIGFIILTGALAAAWYTDSAAPTARDCLLVGAAMPLLIKQAVKAVRPEQHLGPETPFSFWRYFQ